MHDDEYELAKSWLESEDEQVNMHAIDWLIGYYNENFEPKEDRVVSLLLSQSTGGPNGSESIAAGAIEMLGENTRPYDGELVRELIKIARSDFSNRVTLAAIKSLGNFCHFSSANFLLEECVPETQTHPSVPLIPHRVGSEGAKIALESIWSLKRIMMNENAAVFENHRGVPLRYVIIRELLGVAIGLLSKAPFEVREAALLVLQHNHTLEARVKRWENEADDLLDIGFPHSEIRKQIEFQKFYTGEIIINLENFPNYVNPNGTDKVTGEPVGGEVLDHLLSHLTITEIEDLRSLVEITLKWNNGEIEPFEQMGIGLQNQGIIGLYALPKTKEDWKKMFEGWSGWVERNFPELNDDEMYEELAPYIKSVVDYNFRSLMDHQQRMHSLSVQDWIDKDGEREWPRFL